MMTSESGDDNPPTSRRGQNINCFSTSAPRVEKSGNSRRKRRVHNNSAKHLWCTITLSRREPWSDWVLTNNCTGNANTRLRYGSTGTRQCSLYQIILHSNVTVGTDDCEHERHAGATKNTCLGTKQTSEAKKKVLLLELREKFHSQSQNLLSKDSGTSRESVLKKRIGGSEKGCEWWLGAVDNKIKLVTLTLV